MEHVGLLSLALFLLLYGLISKRLEGAPVTPPMLFAAFGLAMGPAGWGLLEVDVSGDVLHVLAEATLILVLFADAAHVDLRILRKSVGLPLRMLGVGLPLSILTGGVVAHLLFPDFGLWEAALLAAILSPTDAALGQAVVSSPKVPARIRQALNVESGLNDGIGLPFVMLFLALAKGDGDHSAAYWGQYALGQLVWGPVAGITIGWAGAKALGWAARHDSINQAFLQLSSLALALLAYCAAEAIGGNGFIAAFMAGLTLGYVLEKKVCEQALEFAETEGQLLGLLAFLVFGAANIAPALMQVGPAALGYAVLSLTGIRMFAVSLSLLGEKLSPATFLFLSWFGPRGLASILYVLLALEGAELPAGDTIFAVVMCTVLLSVLAHGLTAAPGAAWYSHHAEDRKTSMPGAGEHREVEEMPFRIPFRA